MSAVSQNGYPVLAPEASRLWTVPGTGRTLRLAPGAAGFLLAHYATWHHEHVEPLDVGVWDDWGYAVRPVRGQTSGYSNHASGTAIDLNATKHPLGARGTYNSEQASRIRRRLREQYRGAIRWGGDYQSRADEMHFEINLPYARILATAGSMRDSWIGRRVRVANE